MMATPFGFRVVGGKTSERRLVDWRAAVRGHAALDPRAEPERESYLSLFTFGDDFAEHLNRNRSEAGYNGPCGASWLWWDIDRPDDLPAALEDVRRLAGYVLDQYREFDDDDLLVFLSGNKGFHVGIPAVWRPEPGPDFHRIAKAFCLGIAERAGVAVDGSIYSKTRLFRAPNSRHSATNLFKRRVTFRELMHLSAAAIVELAREPAAFEIPGGPSDCPAARRDWATAAGSVQRQAERRPAPGSIPSKLQALTLEFIRDGAPGGERETRLFRAAANVGEFGCSAGLAHALLTEAALDSGLTPSEARRAIDCGLNHARRKTKGES